MLSCLYRHNKLSIANENEMQNLINETQLNEDK